jgi:RimJ/RimL family protein N-acetyltransferase
MTIHMGQPLCDHHVCIGPPNFERLQGTPIAPDVREAVAFYHEQAPVRANCYAFGVYWFGAFIGQIVLHDIDEAAGESLVAYHLFHPTNRNQGIGTIALRLLQQYVQSTRMLRRLVIITSHDNPASQRIAAKCGFQQVGPAREDPEHLIVFAWDVPESEAPPPCARCSQ